MVRATGRRTRRRASYCIGVVSIGVALGVAGAASPARATRTAAIPSVVKAVEDAHRGTPIPSRLIPPIATIRLFPPRYRISPACLPNRETQAPPTRRCRVGEVSSKKLIVLFGDSHAFMWLPAVIAMARRDNWAVVPLIRFGCTPEKWFTHRGPGGPVCRAWLRWAMGELRRLHPTVTLLGGSVGETPSSQTQAAAAGMITAARTLRAFGPLVVIGDPEGQSSNRIPCIVGAHATMAGCITTWPTSALAAYDTVARGTKSLRVPFLPTRGFVCYRRQCPAVVGHTIVWMDTNHLTGIYSAELAAPFRAAFLHALR